MTDNLLFPDEETCWQAVLGRQAEYNGVFVYAVRSTGVYCRPTCPSRRPRREQVRFFPRPEQAEAAGFRPCRRCLPQGAADPQADLAARACRLIEAAPRPPTLAELGQALAVSPYHLQRVFKAATGLSPRQYAAAQREQALKQELRRGQDVSHAAYAAGYGSASRLYEGAASRMGMTPGVYRRGGTGMKVYYTIVDSPLGRMLVASTETGICGLSFGDQDASLEAFLAAEFPRAGRLRDDNRLAGPAAAVLAYLNGAGPRLDLPLDVQATAFQRRVWEELRRIPYGETRTYSQVAQAIGQPSAVRAVAHACASNPAAVVTPCHRVVRSDGSLAGYRWGLSRKQRLLEQERRLASQFAAEEAALVF